LLDSGEETLQGLLRSIRIGPLESEVLLERFPAEVGRGVEAIIVICIRGEFQLGPLPICCPVGAEFEGPLDLDPLGWES